MLAPSPALLPERPRVSLPTLEPARLRRRIILPGFCTQATCTKSLKSVLTGIPTLIGRNGIQRIRFRPPLYSVSQELLFGLSPFASPWSASVAGSADGLPSPLQSKPGLKAAARSCLCRRKLYNLSYRQLTISEAGSRDRTDQLLLTNPHAGFG